MLALLIASAGIARRLAGKHGGIALEAAGTIAAYLTKEQAIVLPCFAAVEIWVALDRPALDRAALVRMLRGAMPQAAIAAGYLAVRSAILPIGPAEQQSQVALGEHALAVCETFGRFTALTLAPHDLSIQQGLTHRIHHEMASASGYVVLGAISTAALLAAAWWTRRRMPIAAVGIAFYLATVLPTSNIAYTDMATLVSERFLYLPMLGLALAIAGLASAALRRWGPRTWAVVAVAVVALGVISARRAADYADEHAFWSRELALHPDSAQARAETVSYIVCTMRSRCSRPTRRTTSRSGSTWAWRCRWRAWWRSSCPTTRWPSSRRWTGSASICWPGCRPTSRSAARSSRSISRGGRARRA
jgi:hypothetical protein